MKSSSNESYLIIQDSRNNKGRVLALADKKLKTKGWWTSVLDNALLFGDKAGAAKVASKLKFNNPRVVPYDVAKKEVTPIVTITHKKVKKRKSIFEMDDWEYKEWLGYSDAIEYGGESGTVYN